MINKISALCQKHRDLLRYLVFGALTTAVNQLTFMGLMRLWPGIETPLPTAVAWFVSVCFAYATNRRWVFASRTEGNALWREMVSFFGARVFSGVLDLGIVFVAADLWGFNADLVKLASNVLVVALNYLFSKFWIFKKREQ